MTTDELLTPAHRIAEQFRLDSHIVGLDRHGQGLINTTFRVTTSVQQHYILQRLNPRVFDQPQSVLANLRTLLDHARTHAASGLQLPELVPTRDGRDAFVDDEGNCWRLLTWIENSCSLETITSLAQAEDVGQALGRFHALLHDLDPSRLQVTLPGFHVTPEYLARYDAAGTECCAPDRSAELQRAREFIEARRAITTVLEEARRHGKLKLRTTHGDPKLNNFLVDTDSGRVLSLIDLDTVQPGLVQQDIADLLRSACNPAGESPASPVDVHFDLDTARAILRGYLAATRGFLTADDHAFLFDAIRLIPFELGLRFLTDHLQGDQYFRTEWPGQNLQRALTQFALTASIERSEPALRALLAELAN